MKSSHEKSDPSESVAVRRPGGRTQDVTNRITRAVVETLIAKGYSALNFQDIADQAEVSRTTLYRRWPTKAELVLDVMSSALAERFQLPDTGSFAGDVTAGLRQIGAALESPFGVATLAASVEMVRAAEGGEPRQELWIRRFVDLLPLLEKAHARRELPEDFDVEAALSALAGAMFYRVFIMARPIDDRWIKRVIATVIPALPHKPANRSSAVGRYTKRRK